MPSCAGALAGTLITITALGCGVGSPEQAGSFDIAKLRSHPIVLMTEATRCAVAAHARLFTERRVRPLLAMSQQMQLDAAGGVLIGFDQQRLARARKTS